MAKASRIRKDGGFDRRFKRSGSKSGCGCILILPIILAAGAALTLLVI